MEGHLAWPSLFKTTTFSNVSVKNKITEIDALPMFWPIGKFAIYEYPVF